MAFQVDDFFDRGIIQFFFQFVDASGCSYTSSKFHEDLPIPTVKIIDGFHDLEHTFTGTKSFFLTLRSLF